MQHTSQRKPLYNSLRSLLPNPGNIIFTLIIVGITLWAQSAGAITLGAAADTDAISTIPYQGYLTDADEKPLTGAHAMKFCLYDSATGGASLWCEQWNGANSVQLTDGLFNVSLGSLNVISQDTIANGALFVGVTIGTDNELAPRAQIGSGVRAMQALSVPDGSITAAKLAPDVLENYVVTTDEKYWDVPTCVGHINEDKSWSAIPSLSIEVDLDESKTIWVDFAGLGESVGPDQYIYSNIFIDGKQTQLGSGIPSISGCRNSEQDTSGNPWCSLSNIASVTLGPGNHTIEARVDCKGSARVYGGTLRALVFP